MEIDYFEFSLPQIWWKFVDNDRMIINFEIYHLNSLQLYRIVHYANVISQSFLCKNIIRSRKSVCYKDDKFNVNT